MKIREQERDVTKLWVTEGADYRYQLTQKDRKQNSVFTIVVYFGTSERWPKSGTLFELLKVPDSLKMLLNDCHVNVLELAWLTDEQIELFKSDFKFVARQVRSERTGEEFIPSDERVTHPDALLELMGALTGDSRFTEAVNNYKRTPEFFRGSFCFFFNLMTLDLLISF